VSIAFETAALPISRPQASGTKFGLCPLIELQGSTQSMQREVTCILSTT
jgi:hypothetical protein